MNKMKKKEEAPPAAPAAPPEDVVLLKKYVTLKIKKNCTFSNCLIFAAII
jgi:hypothetical protein